MNNSHPAASLDERTKNALISTALERGEVRLSLDLPQYLPVIESLCGSFNDDHLKKQTLLLAVLEDIAVAAWRLGLRRGQEESLSATTTDART